VRTVLGINISNAGMGAFYPTKKQTCLQRVMGLRLIIRCWPAGLYLTYILPLMGNGHILYGRN